MTKLDEHRINWASQHLAKFGDTDLFPHPFELKFLLDESDVISRHLMGIDLENYSPMSIVESVVPKSKRGFRFAHQIYPIDNVMFTAALTNIAEQIEQIRERSAGERAFSYRFHGGEDHVFWDTHRHHRDWIDRQSHILMFLAIHSIDEVPRIRNVIRTDISEFYGRIYHHRLDHHLEKIHGNKASADFIKKCLKFWRSRESFGLPVGGNASRLLAELCLVDIDVALVEHGYNHLRYVDDFVIFLDEKQDPYDALVFLASLLMQAERLTLNSAKTQIFSADDYYKRIMPPDDGEKITMDNLVMMASDFDEDHLIELPYDFDTICKYILDEIAKDEWELGKIRILIKSLRVFEGDQVVNFFYENLEKLWPFVKDIVIEMKRRDDFQIKQNGWKAKIVKLHNHVRFRSLALQRAWLLEFFANGIVDIERNVLDQLHKYDDVTAQRQRFNLRYLINDVHYFREYRNKIDEVSPWVQPALVYFSRCLSKDEYETWIDTHKKRLRFPAGEIFASWCKRQRVYRAGIDLTVPH